MIAIKQRRLTTLWREKFERAIRVERWELNWIDKILTFVYRNRNE